MNGTLVNASFDFHRADTATTNSTEVSENLYESISESRSNATLYENLNSDSTNSATTSSAMTSASDKATSEKSESSKPASLHCAENVDNTTYENVRKSVDPTYENVSDSQSDNVRKSLRKNKGCPSKRLGFDE